MRRQLNRTYQPRSEAAHNYFIRWATIEFGGTDYVPDRYQWEDLKLSGGGKEKIKYLYELGFNQLRYLYCTLEKFQDALLFGCRSFKDPCKPLHDPEDYYPGFRGIGNRWREGSRFQQHGIKPKILSAEDLNRRQWRKSKGFSRDRKRNSRRRYGRTKSFVKEISNRRHRSWEAQLMYNEAYEELDSKQVKRLTNIWDWD